MLSALLTTISSRQSLRGILRLTADKLYNKLYNTFPAEAKSLMDEMNRKAKSVQFLISVSQVHSMINVNLFIMRVCGIQIIPVALHLKAKERAAAAMA